MAVPTRARRMLPSRMMPVCVDADVSLGDRVPCVLDGHSQLKGDELDQVEVMSFNEN